jgi:hypothetical protein
VKSAGWGGSAGPLVMHGVTPAPAAGFLPQRRPAGCDAREGGGRR